MQCSKPIFIGKKVQEPVGCGQCMPCRINRRREWTGRILLEAAGYPVSSSFVTLTYSAENVPWLPVDPDWPGATQQCLQKSDLKKWVRRMVVALGKPVRYFACGEYGTITQRPHYHVILFGLDPVQAERLCKETWQMGFVSVSELNPQRAAYTASYTVKKWMKKDTPSLRGRPPEFSVSSRRPGIGVAGLERIVAALQTRQGALIVAEGKVTRTVRLNGKVYPLDRTMTRHMLEALGLPTSYKFSKTTKDETPDENTLEGVKHGKAEVEKAKATHEKLLRRAKSQTAQSSV